MCRRLIIIVFTIWLIICGISKCLHAQNLVSNYSFERTNKPLCQILIFPATDTLAQNISDYVQDWYAPTGGTTDPWFYSDTLNGSAPPSSFCSQNLKRLNTTPHSGRYCIGIANSVPALSGNTGTIYREYIQTRLQNPLRVGAIYNVSYYILRNPEAGTASNNISALFSTNPLKLVEKNFRDFGHLLAQTPQIKQRQIVGNDVLWTRVDDCFRADSAYQYLTIGNFNDDKHTNYLIFPNYRNLTTLCYYFVDDVSVIESPEQVLPALVDLGPDTTLCPNQKFVVNLPKQAGANYRWQNGDTTAHYTIRQSGTYWVTSQAGVCVHSDTIQVRYKEIPALPADTIVCAEEPFWLRPSGVGGPLIWSDNSRTDSLLVQRSGTYWVNIIDSVCALSDSINIQILECPGQIPNVFTPNGDGKNDRFYVNNVQYLPWHLQVFNRWGKQVYEAIPYYNEWDGTGLPTGLYYYYLSNQKIKRAMKGWVELLR